jgi:hypothetical protein
MSENGGFRAMRRPLRAMGENGGFRTMRRPLRAKAPALVTGDP